MADRRPEFLKNWEGPPTVQDLLDRRSTKVLNFHYENQIFNANSYIEIDNEKWKLQALLFQRIIWNLQKILIVISVFEITVRLTAWDA